MNASAYVRVSDTKQEISGLSLQAQKETVTAFAAQRGMTLTEVFVEVESGRRQDNRPRLQAALRQCRETGNCLIISRLDRLGRNAAFLMSLRDSNISFICCDQPELNRLTLGVLSSLAESESENTSIRTKTALRILKARCQEQGRVFFQGQREHCKTVYALGGEAMRKRSVERIGERRGAILSIYEGSGQRKLLTTANLLNELGVSTVSGKGRWTASAVARVVRG